MRILEDARRANGSTELVHLNARGLAVALLAFLARPASWFVSEWPEGRARTATTRSPSSSAGARIAYRDHGIAVVESADKSRQTLADEYGLKPGQIRIALAYADEFRNEVEEQRALGRRSADELHARYPFIQTFEQATAIAGA